MARKVQGIEGEGGDEVALWIRGERPEGACGWIE
jgi:hypothetical protein